MNLEDEVLSGESVWMINQKFILDEMNWFGIALGGGDDAVINRAVWRNGNECFLVVHDFLLSCVNTKK